MSGLNNLEELEAMMAKASRAPWRRRWDYMPLNRTETDPFYVGHGCGPQHYPVKQSDKEGFRKMMDRIEADAMLIEAMRNALPDLIAEIRLLRATRASQLAEAIDA